MLHRPDADATILISQPAHAWVSGQLARAWGNNDFAPLAEEVCLAAEQHDIGFLDWERQPTLNPETGLPYQFFEMPTAVHLRLWTRGIQQMMRYGRYPALLVSGHFAFVATLGEPERSREEQALVERFLKNQETLRTTLTTSLCNDFYYGTRCEPERQQADQEQVSLLDWLSLALLLKFKQERLNRPMRTRLATFQVSPGNADGTSVILEPWPFSADSVTVTCDSRRLLGRFSDQRSLRKAIRAAAPLTLRIELTKALGRH